MGNLAIIPARSGSKGVPDKNIKLLNGKPLMSYTIEAALGAKIFDEVMVSTDSSEYGEIARQYGAKVPFLRSSETSSDRASSWDMVEEVISCYEKLGKFFETFCLLQPTSPFRTIDDIVNAYRIFIEKKAVAVISLCEMEHSPLLCNTVAAGGSLEGFIDKSIQGTRQLLRKYYRVNGAIYFVDVKAFKMEHYLYGKGSYAYVMSQEKSIDIDTEQDFKYAEFLMGGWVSPKSI